MRTIYTDGSCLGNPWPWWWACILQGDKEAYPEEIVLSWGACLTTNNVMELTAAIKALQWLWEKYTGKEWIWTEEDVQEWFFASAASIPAVLSSNLIVITTDSSYVKLGITEWMVVWKRRQWRRAKGGKLVENVALWKQLDRLTNHFPQLTRAWTKAHVGTALNERVDQLARSAAEAQVP